MIAILGAESTGKTSLARALAQEFHSPWVPEYLRSFCENNKRTPRREEQSLILETQAIHERAALVEAMRTQAPFVFCDATPLTTAIYSDYVFGDTALYDRARELHARFAHSLLLANDLAWIADGFFRDGAHVRARIFEMIERALQATDASFSIIKGDGHTRTLAAMHAIDALAKRSTLG